MQGLTIIVAGADAGRFHSALEIGAAHAALGKPTHIFLQSAAVPLLRAGEPGTNEALALLEEAIALGATLTACQSGLALAGMSAQELPQGVETGGLIALLSSRPDDRLLMA